MLNKFKMMQSFIFYEDKISLYLHLRESLTCKTIIQANVQHTFYFHGMESRIKFEALSTVNQQLLGTESGKDNKRRKLFTGACWLESEPVLDHTIPGQEQKRGAGKRPHAGSTLGKSLAGIYIQTK